MQIQTKRKKRVTRTIWLEVDDCVASELMFAFCLCETSTTKMTASAHMRKKCQSRSTFRRPAKCTDMNCMHMDLGLHKILYMQHWWKYSHIVSFEILARCVDFCVISLFVDSVMATKRLNSVCTMGKTHKELRIVSSTTAKKCSAHLNRAANTRKKHTTKLYMVAM